MSIMAKLSLNTAPPSRSRAELQAIPALVRAYRLCGYPVSTAEVARTFPATTSVFEIGCAMAEHALDIGLRVQLMTWNTRLLSPTIFSQPELADALGHEARLLIAEGDDAHLAVSRHEDAVRAGVKLVMGDLTLDSLQGWLRRSSTLLASVDGEFLCQDNGGQTSRWVLIQGCDPRTGSVMICDCGPAEAPQPLFRVSFTRLLVAITLSSESNLIGLSS